MTENVKTPDVSNVFGSLDELIASGVTDVEYKTIDGFAPGSPQLRIGSVTSGEIIEWQEASDGDAKRTAGLRLICRSLVGPEPGNRRYAADPHLIDNYIRQLKAVRTNVTERILKAIIDLNEMTAKDSAAKKG